MNINRMTPGRILVDNKEYKLHEKIEKNKTESDEDFAKRAKTRQEQIRLAYLPNKTHLEIDVNEASIYIEIR